jgi:hypothetical protein
MRPGVSWPIVAKAWATTAGSYRIVGVSTLVPSSAFVVRWPSAASQGIAAGEWPSVCSQGWK